MRFIKYPMPEEYGSLLERPLFTLNEIEDRVRPILQAVKRNGDDALRQYTQKFDGVETETLQVSEKEIAMSDMQVSDELKDAIDIARENIEKFHLAQRGENLKVETTPGVMCWQKAMPIEKVGLYIPGGTAPLFSSVLMLGIPAIIAGCREIVLCSPPDSQGQIHPAILYTASRIGLTKIYKVGGAQAIAAMAYGTESIPNVYKIAGPGNQYVTMAKQMVMSEGISIDMPAGPSEVAVMADSSADPAFVAADLLSQAEHGKDSQVMLISSSEELCNNVQEELKIQLQALPRSEIAEQAIANSKMILINNVDEMIRITNIYAPEHLIISTENADWVAEQIQNAGSVFIGHYTPESAGDYASGTNHTLPTNGYARSFSGVNLDTFRKKITYQKISSQGLTHLGLVIQTMAGAEQLQAHSRAVSIRLDKLNNKNN
ncbi:MAG: histidinol dehydrogenase [Bacteroidetes bacterium]|jgi:histidinol dehydrogenase|nr:histidinol dehydrogenase [Bacteroidota bacterium]